MALAIALAALAIAIATFETVNSMLRLLWAAIAAVLFRGPLRSAYTYQSEYASNQVKVLSAIKGKHKRVKYRACLARNQTLETLGTQVTMVLHTSGKARLDYGLQKITDFTYGSGRQTHGY